MQKYEASRLMNLQSSGAIDFANAMLGAKVTHGHCYLLHDGELDLPPAQEIIDATQEALTTGKTRYDDIRGLTQLRWNISKQIWRDDRVATDIDDLLVTNGSSQAIFEIFQCYVSPGDRVLIPTPAWPTYEQGVRMAGGIPVGYPCLSPELDFDQMRCLVQAGAKMLIVNSPHNPTGVVLSRDTLVRLIELATEFDMLVLADHAYEAFHHPTVERISLRAVADTERARVITTGSFSKSHSMTGFRVGYVHATREIIDRCATLHAHLTDNVCTFAQYGAVAATELPPTYLSSRASLIQDRLEAAHALISKVLPCPRPHGGFYVFPDLTPVLGGRWKDGTDFAIDLLKEAGVSILAGGTFGSGRHIRISIAGTERDLVESATRRIVAFIESRY